MFEQAKYENNRICPNCQKRQLKHWNELTADEQFTAERMPMSAEFSAEERKRHLFCPNCWYETVYQIEQA
jgi:hypothetical protein